MGFGFGLEVDWFEVADGYDPLLREPERVHQKSASSPNGNEPWSSRKSRSMFVLTDIEMPGAMNGFAFAKCARLVRPELDIVLAGTPERAAYAAAELCEAGPLLTKPYDHKLVLGRISTAE
jgi:DNA-binding LytR/AlgR family response regulator